MLLLLPLFSENEIIWEQSLSLCLNCSFGKYHHSLHMPLPSHTAQMNLDLHSLHVHSRKTQGKKSYPFDIKFTLRKWIQHYSHAIKSTDWVCFWKKKRLLNIYREINFYLVRVCTVWGWGKQIMDHDLKSQFYLVLIRRSSQVTVCTAWKQTK